ncbi:hypothetical protein C8Q75DRAFT_364943 [Abortiporus biennis]|nr:hypothetical protein C8Q75DRAFT_364943 [Abortiporus biennis]
MISHEHYLAHFHDNAKQATPGPLYLRQPRTLEIIQLVEVDAPPRQQPSSFASSSVPSSSAYSASSTSSDFDPDDEQQQSEEEESVVSSYCSSDEEEMVERKIGPYDDTYGTRINRILTWRENFAKAMGVAIPHNTASHASHLLLKRKMEEDGDDDAVSLSSKRSRHSEPAEQPPKNYWAHRRLSSHSCPACDACFNTRQSLQQHGKESQLNDACRVAVEYGLEP